MSFEINCPNCAAPSNPSVGICPYCKTILAPKGERGKVDTTVTALKKKYREGKLGFVLRSCDQMLRNKPKYKENVDFLIFYVKVLIQADASTSKIRTVLSWLSLYAADNLEAIDLIELVEAKDQFTDEKDDLGEQKMRALIKRDPNNYLAHFLLGAHLYWVEKDYRQAIIHLEKTVQSHKGFLRAWGCLGALYKSIGQFTQGQQAFLKAAELESESSMRQFFKEQAKICGKSG